MRSIHFSRSAAPGLNDARQPRDGARIFREASEFLYQPVDFLPRGKAIFKDGISDVFQGDGGHELDLAFESCRLDDCHFNLLQAAVGKQNRQAWANVRIAAPFPDPLRNRVPCIAEMLWIRDR